MILLGIQKQAVNECLLQSFGTEQNTCVILTITCYLNPFYRSEN